MAAAEAVLTTAELLENIILQVPDPAYNIQPLKEVARLWNKLIRDSPRIKKARCLRPVGYDCKHVHGYYEDQGYPDWCSDGIPRYPAHSNMQFCSTSEDPVSYPSCDGVAKVKTISIIPSHESVLPELDPDRCVTFPRCSAVFLQVPYSMFSDWDSCVLVVQDGVKISDILRIHNAVEHQYERYQVPKFFRANGIDVSIVGESIAEPSEA